MLVHRHWSQLVALGLVLVACNSGDESAAPFANACATQGLSDCGGVCANLTNDATNCGACGVNCNGAFCNNGVCQATCDAGLTACGYSCVNVTADPLNCGTCAAACQQGQACQNGVCVGGGAGTGGTPGSGGTGGTGVLPDNSGLYGFFPTTVTEDYARGVYEAWRTEWTASCPDGSLRVKWDNAAQTVSEGIGYGMLLAAAWGDRTTFDGLWAYYQSHTNARGLMGWIGACGSVADQGAASDADLDAAMALLIADCVWAGAGYGASATTIITALRNNVFKTDGSHTFLCAGDNWGTDCCGNASYQAPGYYRAFGKHTGDEAFWNQAADDSYYYLTANSNATTGLVSDWMDPDALKCDAKGWGDWHGWDASRMPWRVTTDYVWWNSPAAQAHAAKIAAFVNTKGGVANTCQGYSLNGATCGGTAVATFAGAFASTGIVVDQATADAFFNDLKGVDHNGYFNSILNALYFTLAAKRFTAGCY